MTVNAQEIMGPPHPLTLDEKAANDRAQDRISAERRREARRSLQDRGDLSVAYERLAGLLKRGGRVHFACSD